MERAIVLAVDFSEPSMAALEACAALARDLGARVVVVHAFDPIPEIPVGAWTPVMDPSRPYKAERRIEEARELSEQWTERLRAEGVEAESAVGEGDPAELALEHAKIHDAGLIVVGSHGWGRLRRLVLGSVSEALLRRSPVPVLVVPWRH